MRIPPVLPVAACTLLLLIGGCAAKEPATSAPTDAPAPATTGIVGDGATLPPAPGFTVMQNNCQACHSLDMVYTQRLSGATWNAEVMKMKRFGAPVSSADASTLIAYLSRYLSPTVPRSGERKRVDAPADTTANPPAP
ncbi:MAG: hypothetical protein NVSMB64_17880 [Candidatus Velthaea sp.]